MGKWTSTLLLALLAIHATGPAFAAEDKKVYPGTLCQPSTADAAFRRDNFGHFINTSSTTQQVFCPIVRDSFGPKDDVEQAEIRLFESMPATPPSCILRVVDVAGSPASQYEASQNTKPGSNRILRFGSGAANISTPADAMLLFACTIPPQSAVTSYSVIENVGEP